MESVSRAEAFPHPSPKGAGTVPGTSSRRWVRIASLHRSEAGTMTATLCPGCRRPI